LRMLFTFTSPRSHCFRTRMVRSSPKDCLESRTEKNTTTWGAVSGLAASVQERVVEPEAAKILKTPRARAS
jgi:hypothetical protein